MKEKDENDSNRNGTDGGARLGRNVTSVVRDALQRNRALEGPSKQQAAIPQIELVDVNEISLTEPSREYNQEGVDDLAESIAELGLKTPITVRRKADPQKTIELVAGFHRYKAVCKLGWPRIPCIFLDEDNRRTRMWTIAENVHRIDLSVLERSRLINDWVSSLNEGGQVAHPGGRQPHDAGLSRAARQTKLSRRTIRRARQMGKLKPEAARAVVKAKLDNNEQAILKIAAEPTLAEQLSKVTELSSRKSVSEPTQVHHLDSMEAVDIPDTIERFGTKTAVELSDLATLKTAWSEADGFRQAWTAAAEGARKRFVVAVLGIREL